MQLKGNRIGGYARYSSDKQNVSSVDDQLRRFRIALAPVGRDLNPALTFTDHAISGKSIERPGFEALMQKVKAREIDVLIVEDVSRLARNQSDATRFYEELAYYGVQLISLDDGIDSQSKGAKLQYGVKALFADLYLDDLREKTLRGMEGRALAGMATGGRLLGYRSVAQLGPDGRTPAGYLIEIDPDAAKLVRRIFFEYLAGQSFNGIAKLLNAEGVPAPRDRTMHKRKTGWAQSTIRAILYNERYAGTSTFNERRWVKIPGSNKRRPERKDPSEIIRVTREDLRIIESDIWDAVKERLRSTKDKFTRDGEGKAKGRAHGAVSRYPFSGLLECAACDGLMVITGGRQGDRYYGCANARRGRCTNHKTISAERVKTRIMQSVHDLLVSDEGIAFARKRIAEGLGELSRNRDAELKEKRARIGRIEARIANLIEVLASGERSEAISNALRDMEAHAATERRAISDLERLASDPIRLPTPDEVMARFKAVQSLLDEDPLAAREELKRYFAGPKIRLEVDENGNYMARWGLLPAIFLGDSYSAAPGDPQGRRFYVGGSGGRICQTSRHRGVYAAVIP